MKNIAIIHGRETTYEDITLVQKLIAANPDWRRARLSKELCELWNWDNPSGQLKDMACRTFLLKLEQRGHLTLPKRRRPGGSSYKTSIPKVPHKTDPILGKLKPVAPVTVKQVDKTCLDFFKCLINQYHGLEKRQEYDIPPLELIVSEHQVENKLCPCCGLKNQAPFPNGVEMPVQYGRNIKSLLVYLNQYQKIPYKRAAELIEDVYGFSLSEATVFNSTCATFEALESKDSNSDTPRL